MAPHLEIFNYLHLLVLLIWSSDAAMLLKSTSFVNSRKHSIISRSTSAYSGGSRQRQKISMIQRRDPLQNKSSKLDHVRGSEIFDRRYSIGSKVNDRELSRKRSEKCSHLFNEVQPGKYPEDRNDAFAEELMNMRGREIAEAMFMSAKFRKGSGGIDCYTSHLLAIADRLNQFPSNRWRSKDIAFMVYGMQSMRIDDVGTIEFLRVITRIIEDSVQIRGNGEHDKLHQIFTARDISMVLYGLQGLRSVCADVRHLLAVLAPRTLELSGKLDMIAVGQALYGMQRMSSDCGEVRSLISALTTQVRRCDERFDSQAVSNTIYGMQEMSSNHQEVRDLLTALIPKIRECSNKLSVKELSNVMCGLRRLRSDHCEVRSLLLTLTEKDLECEESPNEVMLGNLFAGLQGMSTDHAEVLPLVIALKNLLLRCSQQLSADALSKALHGLQRADSALLEVREVVQALAEKMIKSQDVFKADNIGTALYGMQRLSADHVEVRFLLTALHSKIEKCRAHPNSIDVKERKFKTFSKKDLPHMRSTAIANALCGLQNMDSNHVEVRRILFALTPLLKNTVDDFSSSALANALYGMQKMRSDHSEVRTILSCLTPRLTGWKEPSASDLGRGLSGLSSMSCSYGEVREMIEVIVPNMERCQEIFSSQSIADAMSGLRCMSSGTAVVRDLLLVLVPKIQSCTDTFTAQDIHRTLSSLRGMDSEYSEVLTLLLVMVLKVKNCEEDFSAGMVSDILNGLQGLSNKHFEVRTLLFAIIPRVKNCKGTFTGREIGKALWGLQGLMGKVESQSLLEFFYERAQLLEVELLDTAEMVTLSKCLTVTLLSEIKVVHKDQHLKWLTFNNFLLEELDRRRSSEVTSSEKGIEITTDSLVTCAPIISAVDDDSGLISRCKSVFKETSVRIFCNRVLLGLFESDIALQVSVPDQARGAGLSHDGASESDSTEDTTNCFVINIEVDRGKYDADKGPRYCQLRDKYLKSKGIFTVRVRSIDIKSTGSSILNPWLERMVSTFTERYKERKAQALYDESIYDSIG